MRCAPWPSPSAPAEEQPLNTEEVLSTDYTDFTDGKEGKGLLLTSAARPWKSNDSSSDASSVFPFLVCAICVICGHIPTVLFCPVSDGIRMIARISGRLAEVSEGSALVHVGGGLWVSQGQTSDYRIGVVP